MVNCTHIFQGSFAGTYMIANEATLRNKWQKSIEKCYYKQTKPKGNPVAILFDTLYNLDVNVNSDKMSFSCWVYRINFAH